MRLRIEQSNNGTLGRSPGAILLSLLCAFFLAVSATGSAAPGTLEFHGKLTANGTSITTSTELIFSFWDAPVGGNKLSYGFAGGIDQFVRDVTPDSNGGFSTVVGATPPDDAIQLEIFHRSSTVWLDLQINGNEVAPRQRVTSAAYALNALSKYGSGYLMTDVTSDTVNNGLNLIQTYNLGKTLTPNGQPLSSTNRATVLVAPDSYNLGSSELVMDAQFVDLVGLTSSRQNQYIFGTSNGPNTGVLRQTANDVKIENLVIECTRMSGGLATDETDPAAYFPDSGTTATVLRNCEFRASLAVPAWNMRQRIAYPGSFTDCVAGDYGFGSNGGTASGTFTRCSAGNYSFGGMGIASGTFSDCNAGDGAFAGLGGIASGTFRNCRAGYAAFGGGNTFPSPGNASGTFQNCSGDTFSFGGDATASGQFTNCTGGLFSFGGGNTGGAATGSFVSCTGGGSSFGVTDSSNGKFYYCSAGADGFTTAGIAAPVFRYCLRNGSVFPP